ncbi:hypothetical protein ACW9HQ_42775, partial [Nocardia gipuzkoensis]
MDDAFGLFVGVGIDEYESLAPLTHAVAEVNGIGCALRPHYVGTPITDATEDTIRSYLREATATPAKALVMVWCGHGSFAGG